MSIITETLSKAVLLEQAAEECSELAAVCSKMARKLRGENPTPMETNDILAKLCEEAGDVTLCLMTLIDAGLLSQDSIDSVVMTKESRWEERLKERKQGGN